MKKKIFALFLAVLMTLAMTGGVHALAASSNPYPDVTKKTVGTKAYEAIDYLKARGAFNKKNFTIKNGKFDPAAKIKRKEVVAAMVNLYGKNVIDKIIDTNDVIKADSVATSKWLYGKFVLLAREKGVNLTWEGGDNTKVSRRFFALATMNAIDEASELEPHKR